MSLQSLAFASQFSGPSPASALAKPPASSSESLRPNSGQCSFSWKEGCRECCQKDHGQCLREVSKVVYRGTWVAHWVEHLPSAWVVISGSWDGALCRAPCSVGSLLLPLLLPTACDVSLSCLSESLSLSQINKILKKRTKKENNFLGMRENLWQE